jgi:hypothetical protein
VRSCAGQTLDIDKLIPPRRNVGHTLETVFIKNRSVLWQGNVLKHDEDIDGIPDETEQEIGSSPSVYDTDGNGVGDGVEYYSTGKPCKDTNCNSLSALPFKSCDSFIKTGWLEGDLEKYNDIDGDGLNDCEETAVIDSKRDNFDSNNDWINDLSAFNTHGAIKIVGEATNNGSQLDPDSDGVTNAQEFKLGTPYTHNNELVQHLEVAKYKLTLISKDDRQTCYKLNVNNIIGLGNTSKLELSISEKSMVDDKRFLRRVIKEVSSGGTAVFTPQDLLPPAP